MFELTDVYYINLISISIILHSRCFLYKIFLRFSKLINKTKDICLTKLLLPMKSIWLNYINSFWLFRNCVKTCFCMRKHRYLKNDYQFFDALKTVDCKIWGNCNLLKKVKLERSSTLNKLALKVFYLWHISVTIAVFLNLQPLCLLHDYVRQEFSCIKWFVHSVCMTSKPEVSKYFGSGISI